jgi:prepilin-type N-terminal cleavage/methylation domain-containing protein
MSFKRDGFTLTELTVGVVILGALAFAVLPRISESSTKAKGRACNANLKVLNTQIEMYGARNRDGARYHDGEMNHNYPLNYNKLSTDTDYFPDGPPECPYGEEYKIDHNLMRVIPHTFSEHQRHP